jgi:hypothetical protein
VRKAVGDDVAFREFGDNFLSKVAQKGLAPLQALDGLMRSTAVAGAYQRIAAEKGIEVNLSNPDKQIIQEATKLMRQSQGSSFFKDQPLSITTSFGLMDNRSLNKTILTFQSFMLSRWDNLQRQIWRMGIKEKKYGKAIMSFLWMVIIAAAMEEGIRRGVKYGISKATGLITGKEDEADSDSFAKNAVLNIIQGVPVMGQLVSSMEYASNPVPVLNTFDQLRKGLDSMWGGKELRTKIRGGVSMAGAAGTLLGIPGSSQVAQIVKETIPTKKTSGGGGNVPTMKMPSLKMPSLKMPSLKQ